MCGIAAIYAFDKAVQPEQLSQAISSLFHRGPDNQNLWLDQQHSIGLAHARLSIIDLASGQQPLSDEQQQCHLVVNGEFYDFERIRKQLEQQGARFKTRSDSEIALHLYLQQGLNSLQSLRGEFAFCLYDNASDNLIAARDRLGIKPLYYSIYGGQLLIASEIKALLAAGVPAEWNEDAYYSRAFYYQNASLFKHIHQVPPGHYLLATRSGIRLIKYWDFDYPLAGDEACMSKDEAVKQVRERLLDAVQTRLRSDVPVGVYLSGGIDSCAILGMVSELASQPPEAFTLSFDDADYDESAIARDMASRTRANHHILRITQDELADHFFAAIGHSEGPCMNAHGVAKYLLSRYVQQHGYRVVLTGEGADEIFAGYASFKQDMQSGDSDSLSKTLGQDNRVSAGLHYSLNHGDQTHIRQVLGFAPAWLAPLGDIQLQLAGLFTQKYSERDNRLLAEKQWLNQLDLNQLTGREPLNQALYTLSRTMLPNYILTTLGDRMEMAHSLEGRVPFLDHQVIDLVKQLPATFKIHQGQEKHLLREAVRPYVSEQVYQRQKHPFFAPPSITHRDSRFYQLLHDTLHSQAFAQVPFFDHGRVKRYLAQVDSLQPNQWPAAEAVLMELLSLCALQQQFGLSA